ncbi:gamma-glutamylcyclotransferase [Bacillus sp. SB49]|uniref:gamma-glutamylcyclotransferase n=1 Tax=Bacillus sp. SB49 TaxID=1071080 RepID=UPI0004118E95|nr:gamma-glutamylcyclotransferase family protein [Bacillus sp. SB49]QHT46797.1 gamma-glutamylcyclotransferase [Bacillus sp. SB49]
MLVFVYGSLMTGMENHHVLSQAPLLAKEARVNGRLYEGESYYPLLVEEPGAWTYGELYEVDERDLVSLDALEEYDPETDKGTFIRKSLPVWTDSGKEEAYVYVASEESLGKPVASGNWKVHRLLVNGGSCYYFAYGSCMDDERFAKHGVDRLFQNVTGRGSAKGYRLGFTYPLPDGARADLVEAEGNVEGVVYEINEEARQYLYRREGVDRGGYRPMVLPVALASGNQVEALSFTVREKQPESAPPFHYAKEIHRGAGRYLSRSYVDEIEKRFAEEVCGEEFRNYLLKRS